MIATLTVGPEANRSATQPDFLAMLPAIRRVASYTFRHLRRAVREELIAEVVANAFAAFRRLVERGKSALAYPTVLAKFAIRQVRDGRGVGQERNVLDVMSAYGQRRKGFSVLPFAAGGKRNEWQEMVVEDRCASPADIAGFRIDFAAWLKQLKRSKREVALQLAAGDTTSEVAGHFRMSASRVSQLRNELQQDWEEFQAMPAMA
jgi:hypothetical protein